MKGSFSLWENRNWLCFFQDLYLLSNFVVWRCLSFVHHPGWSLLVFNDGQGEERQTYLIPKTCAHKDAFRNYFSIRDYKLSFWIPPHYLDKYICTTISTANLTYLMLQIIGDSFCSTYFHFKHITTKHVTWSVVLFLLTNLVILLTKYP